VALQSNSDQILYEIGSYLASDKVKTGGSPVTSYSFEVDDGNGGSFVAKYGNTTDSLATQFLHTVTKMRGKTFRARYRVRNVVGWSGYSPVG
jgi:hypothetical protein